MSWKKHKQYRLLGYDYSQNGAYFITVVVKNRYTSFGIITDAQLLLSPLGTIVEENIAIVSDRKKDIQIEEYQVMPDHIHLILTIESKSHDASYNFASGLRPISARFCKLFYQSF